MTVSEVGLGEGDGWVEVGVGVVVAGADVERAVLVCAAEVAVPDELEEEEVNGDVVDGAGEDSDEGSIADVTPPTTLVTPPTRPVTSPTTLPRRPPLDEVAVAAADVVVAAPALTEPESPPSSPPSKPPRSRLRRTFESRWRKARPAIDVVFEGGEGLQLRGWLFDKGATENL